MNQAYFSLNTNSFIQIRYMQPRTHVTPDTCKPGHIHQDTYNQGTYTQTHATRTHATRTHTPGHMQPRKITGHLKN